ncbi:MAG: TerC family protein [Saprospiraceae bacterium]
MGFVELFSMPETWVSLMMLTFMEIILGIDNIIFITIASNKLPKEQQKRATNIGLLLAMGFRIMLLFGISYLIAMQSSIFDVNLSWLHAAVTGQSIILAIGGLFLIYKATSEIHEKLEGGNNVNIEGEDKDGKKTTLTQVVIQICLINIVFSFDSILTAVGLTDSVPVMIVAVIVSMGIMMLFANPVGKFVNENPTIQMLGLSFLILIGFMLIAEGAHLSHFEIFGSKVGVVPKGYLYFAIFFSLTVEFLNMKLRKRSTEKVKLYTYQNNEERKEEFNGSL